MTKKPKVCQDKTGPGRTKPILTPEKKKKNIPKRCGKP
jgi:hypothetical protein